MSAIYWRISHRFLTRVSAPRSRYPIPNALCENQANDSISPQYYALATGTILFYDYLLTLEDEVRQVFHQESHVPSFILRLAADQIHLV